VANGLGWRWIGYLGALICGGSLIVFYLGLEETEFQRDRYLQAHVDNADADAYLDAEQPIPKDSGRDAEKATDATTTHSFASYPPKTYWDRIRIITLAPNLHGTGFKQYLHRLWHTLRVFTFPAVWYAGLQWGFQQSCLTFYLTVQEDWWYGEPWNYSSVAVGNMNLPTLIGSLIGCAYGGYGSDAFMQWMIKRNKGVMEAEFRLYLMALCTLIFPTGMWLFGIGSARGWPWPVPYVGLGFIGFGYGCAGDLSLSYLADSFP
jgi:hypothetical protein